MKRQTWIASLVALLLLSLAPTSAFAGAFLFASESTPNRVAHPPGSSASGGSFNVTICIDPNSTVTTPLVIPVQNLAKTFTDRMVTSPNLTFGGANNVPFPDVDFESVALHELGHCLGLGHTNLGSAVGSPNDEFANSGDGVDNIFDFDDGVDNIQGSADDQRNDDVNLVWFFKGVNNPLSVMPTVDSTTYGRLVADLPGGDSFPVSLSRDVALNSFATADTEAVMKQLSFNDEAQRTLAADDVTQLKYGQAGLDELQGTADDYTFTVSYVGITTSCDVTFATLDSAGFATCGVSASVNGEHRFITSGSAEFADPNNVDWFFNDISNADTPMPMMPAEGGPWPMLGLVGLILLTLSLALATRKA